MTESLERLRAAGWQMVHHVDTARHGGVSTLWFFVHPCGRWVSGTGSTYEEAWRDAEAAAGSTDVTAPPDLRDAARWTTSALLVQNALNAWERERGTYAAPRHPDLAAIWNEARQGVLDLLDQEFLSEYEPRRLDTPGERRIVADLESVFRRAGFVSRKGGVLRGRAFVERFRSAGSSRDAGEVRKTFAALLATVEAASPEAASELRRHEAWVADRSAEEWSPIADAPHDGDGARSWLDVDLWHRENGRVADCRWNADEGFWVDRAGRNVGTDEDFTHWRRVPAPPKEMSP